MKNSAQGGWGGVLRHEATKILLQDFPDLIEWMKMDHAT